MNLHETIYQLRTARNMSQLELAEALDVSRQSISKWETGTAVPELDKLVRLSDVFGITLDELVRGTAETGAAEPKLENLSAAQPAKPTRRYLLWVFWALWIAVFLLMETVFDGFLHIGPQSLPVLKCLSWLMIFAFVPLIIATVRRLKKR